MIHTINNFNPIAIINHAALRHNLDIVKKFAPNSRIWAVVKANAYGHGVEEVTRTLATEGFAVARLEEAKNLRRAGNLTPILIMGGVYSANDIITAVDLNCELVIHTQEQAQMLLRINLTRSIKIWIKVNTGMNRLGLTLEQAAYWITTLAKCQHVQSPLGLITHLANADDLADNLTNLQCQRLRTIPGSETCIISIGNSAGILGWQQTNADWVRPGIMLYGISPFNDASATNKKYSLKPVMTLQAPLIAIHHCQSGDAIGYGGSYVCSRPTTVGVIGIGYGDGYPRHVPTGTPVLINGERIPLIGRVSMDMLTVDLTNVPTARIGDQAVLWGDNLPAEEIATAANTIAYQLVTGVTSRVQRLHVR